MQKDPDEITSDFELLDEIRCHLQVFTQGIYSLQGILTGFGLAKKNDSFESNMLEFHRYLSKKNGVNPQVVDWMNQIRDETKDIRYEIPIFFSYLDEYRGIEHETLDEITLSEDQRVFDFNSRLSHISVDYPKWPIKPPHVMKVIRMKNKKVYAFFFDQHGLKYYEHCLREVSRLKEWAKECFDIDPSDWKHL